MSNLLDPKDRVLSTLNKDGSRRWLRPRLSTGKFFIARRIVAYTLIALFALLPYIKIKDKPAILLDIASREFTFFGFTFLPTDTVLLAIFLIGIVVSIFLVTALFGRVWCGWACPQTVYMEYLFRPIERLIEGAPRNRQSVTSAKGWRMILKYVVYLLASMFVAHIFLAYFVGRDELVQWVQQSPFEHPTSFLVMASVTGLMLFDFGFFREQVCIVVCPYGRFQSVMLDRNSLVITYDDARGEPRGKLRKSKKTGDLSLPVAQGDCVDCRMYVTTCPTGIGIRQGLQMECIGCAQCIDACNSVMKKIGKPLGLIRYSSQKAMEGEKWRLLRPRVLMYPVILIVLITLFAVVLEGRSGANITLLRGRGRPFVVTDDDRVSNQMQAKITNRTDEVATYMIRVADRSDIELIVVHKDDLTLEPGQVKTFNVLLVSDRSLIDDGPLAIDIEILLAGEVISRQGYRLLGPERTQ